ncbi:MAG: hypothetical protein H0T46_13625 [Deltaproteobacteria bacterium]|nr:hypothetical protein [Deltaproteobacteria bacterium]
MGTVISAALATSAWAGPALDDGSSPTADPTTGMPTVASEENPVEYGVGLRLRNVRVPVSVLELFVERSAGGASNVGFGVELIRRRGTVELQLGFEFEHLEVGEGVWINKGENVGAGDEADYILAPEHAPNESALGWFTIEFTFINHAVINKYLSFRYGGGAGLGIITGDLYRYNVICNGATNSMPEPGCVPPRFPDGRGSYSEGTQTEVKYDLPPVFPVINGIIGVQIKPTDKMVINLETGIRTVPFLGTSVAYFF